jgi:hypothetical protein
VSELVAQFESMTKAQRRSVALVQYACNGSNCWLLTVWQGGGQRFWYKPAYKLSEATALAETVDMARAKRTKDGLQRWHPSAGSFDDLIDNPDWLADEELGLSVNCPHLRNHVISWRELRDDAANAAPGKATWIGLPRAAPRT